MCRPMPNGLDLTPLAARVGYFDSVCHRIPPHNLNLTILDLVSRALT
jgi:hypothetical protein